MQDAISMRVEEEEQGKLGWGVDRLLQSEIFYTW
jgi:hypothetical protein